MKGQAILYIIHEIMIEQREREKKKRMKTYRKEGQKKKVRKRTRRKLLNDQGEHKCSLSQVVIYLVFHPIRIITPSFTI